MTAYEKIREALTFGRELLPGYSANSAEFDEALAALADLAAAVAEPVTYQYSHPSGAGKIWRNEQHWNGHTSADARALYAAPPPAKPAPDIYDAYKSWPEDIRKKLSLHDLRRMSGWRMQAEFNPLNHEQSR